MPLYATAQDIRDYQARQSFATFVEVTFDKRIQLEPWQRLICERLQKLRYQTGQRIAICAGPQFGKSILVSQRLPAWLLGHHPSMRIPLATYNEEHSQTFSRVTLELMQSAAYRRIFDRPECYVNSRAAWGSWATQGRMAMLDGQPSMMALGLHSGFVGKGADLLILDDVYKDRQEAYSPVTRESVWKWFLQTANVRLTPAANVIVNFHRWHEDDMMGRLIARGGWEVLRFPAIADGRGDDPTDRAIGDILSPRYPLDFLEKLREEDETGFMALFQGLPVAEGGNILKEHWWKYWYPTNAPPPPPVQKIMPDGSVREIEQVPLPTEFTRWIQSWDTNMIASATSDFTVGQVWARRSAEKYLIDQVKARADVGITATMVKDLTKRYPQATAKYIEAKASGPQVIRTLKATISGLIAVKPEGDKTSRVRAVEPTISAGDVYLPHPTLYPWVNALIGECSSFPTGKNDDQVDAMTQALSKMLDYHYEEETDAKKGRLPDPPEWEGLAEALQFQEHEKHEGIYSGWD